MSDFKAGALKRQTDRLEELQEAFAQVKGDMQRIHSSACLAMCAPHDDSWKYLQEIQDIAFTSLRRIGG